MIELSNSKKTFLGKTASGRDRWSLDCSISAIQFRENGGAWQDINPSIEVGDTGGFSVKFTQVPYLGRIGDDSHRRIYPDRTNLDCWIEFQKPYPSMGLPTRSDRWFYWNFPNAILGIRFDNASVKFGFRLKNASAPTSITIPFTTQGITRQGRLLYHDGKVIAELRKPVAIDANDVVRECEVSFGSGQVTISLDTMGLAFPIDIDPTLDLQVGANLDDVYERESTGAVTDSATSVLHNSNAAAAGRFWGAHRWTSGSLPSMGDTIDVAYVELYIVGTTNDDINGNWHFEELAAPAQFTTNAFDVTARDRTEASVSDIGDTLGVGWHQTPSLVTPLQEVIDAYSPTAVVLIFRPNQDATKNCESRPYNATPAEAAKLHIEYTAGAAVVPRHGFVNFQVPGIV